MAQSKRYVFYPGHLGEKPHTELPGRRGFQWSRKHPVRLVAEPYASALIRDSGFLPAFTVKEAARMLGCTMKLVQELIEDGVLSKSRFEPPTDEKAVDVVILAAADSVRAQAALLRKGK